jgi:hypothetical protein
MNVKLENGVAMKRRLLSLPEAEWRADPRWWDALLLVPTRKVHDSGYATVAIIGVEWRKHDGHYAQEILAYPDAIQFPAWSGIPGRQGHASLGDYGVMNMDCYQPSGILRLFSSDWEFQADGSSSVEIKLRARDKVTS